VEDARHKAGADPLNLMRSRLSARQDRRFFRFHGNHFEAWLARLQHLPNASDRAARPDTGNDYVDRPLRVVPDFLGRGPPVNLRIGRVLELLRNHSVRRLRNEFLSSGNGPFHPERRRSEHKLRAEQRQHLAALDRHGFGHHEDQAVAMRGRHKSERNARIARGRLDEDVFAGRNLARVFQGLDHRNANAVFYAAYGVEEFELGEEVRLDALFARQLAKAHDWGVSDCFGDGFVDAAPAWSLIVSVMPGIVSQGSLRFFLFARISKKQAVYRSH